MGFCASNKGTELVYFGVFDGYWRFFSNSPFPLMGIYIDSLVALLRCKKWESAFLAKPQKRNSCETVSQFTQLIGDIFNIYLAHNTM